MYKFVDNSVITDRTKNFLVAAVAAGDGRVICFGQLQVISDTINSVKMEETSGMSACASTKLFRISGPHILD